MDNFSTANSGVAQLLLADGGVPLLAKYSQRYHSVDKFVRNASPRIRSASTSRSVNELYLMRHLHISNASSRPVLGGHLYFKRYVPNQDGGQVEQ